MATAPRKWGTNERRDLFIHTATEHQLFGHPFHIGRLGFHFFGNGIDDAVIDPAAAIGRRRKRVIDQFVSRA